MSKRLILVLITLIFITGCNRATPQTTVDQAAPTPTPLPDNAIVDQRDQVILLPDQVSSIVAIPMPAASLIVALDGSADRIAGLHPAARTAAEQSILGTIAPSLLESNTSFISQGFSVNLEELLALNPDIVLQWSNQGDDIIDPLDQAGIRTVGLSYGTQQDLETWINLIGKIVDKPDRAQSLIDWQQSIFAQIKTSTAKIPDDQRPTVLYLAPVETLRTVGGDTYNQTYFDATAAINLSADTTGFNNLTMEQIIAWDPDIIYVGNFGTSTADDILSNSIDGQDWSTLTAVKNDRVYQVPLGGYRWDPPNQESPLMWLWLLRVQHPDNAIGNLLAQIKGFYAEYYGYQLTDQEIADILRCDIGSNSTLSICQEIN